MPIISENWMPTVLGCQLFRKIGCRQFLDANYFGKFAPGSSRQPIISDNLPPTVLGNQLFWTICRQQFSATNYFGQFAPGFMLLMNNN
jgi:hypothetical protein